jgi:hypothetical protein
MISPTHQGEEIRMERSSARIARPQGASKPLDFRERLKEIDMFFLGRGREHQTLRRLARNLKKAGVPYAIMGGMAVNAHGAERTTRDVDVLLTPEGFEPFQRAFVGSDYDRVAGRPRRFVDRRAGITVDVLLTGRFPGSGRPGPIAFPDPADVSEEIKRIHFLKLTTLIQLKLAASRHYDFGDVVFLIRAHNLDESFKHQLHATVQQDFIECLEEKRREDEYEAREG